MSLLLLGLLLFAGVHLVPSLAPSLKTSWLEKFGEGGYKGSFSLLLLVSIALMIGGWRSTVPSSLYVPSPALHLVALAIMALAFVLLVVSNRNSRLRLLVRHPQLTGVALWGFAHLLLNGDNRSVLLFGALCAWAIVEILAINRRDGVWIKTDAPAWSAELITLIIAALVIAITVAVHPWLSGMPVI